MAIRICRDDGHFIKSESGDWKLEIIELNERGESQEEEVNLCAIVQVGENDIVLEGERDRRDELFIQW